MSGEVHLVSRGAPITVFMLGAACVVTVLVTAFVSPLFVDLLQVFGFAEARLDEVSIRTLELVAIALTFTALRFSGGSGAAAWAVPRREGLVRRLGIGFLYGLLSLGLVCVVLWFFDTRVVRHDLSMDAAYWLRVFANAMLSAAAVGMLEEFWFRGGLFTLLGRCGGVAVALFGGALLYAAAHFLAIPGGLDTGASPQWSGLQVLAAATQNIFQLQNLDSFVALFIAGVTLGVVRLRHGDVAMCIGIHAGWVLTIKVFKKLTYVSPTQTNRALAGQYDDVIGWVAAVCLAAMLILIWFFVRPAKTV